jgi:hypothetical protein
MTTIAINPFLAKDARRVKTPKIKAQQLCD